MAEIVYAYKRKLPIVENLYCDFYIPTGKAYIEFWGYDNNEKHLARKLIKQAVYQKYNLNLIELADGEVVNHRWYFTKNAIEIWRAGFLNNQYDFK